MKETLTELTLNTGRWVLRMYIISLSGMVQGLSVLLAKFREAWTSSGYFKASQPTQTFLSGSPLPKQIQESNSLKICKMYKIERH